MKRVGEGERSGGKQGNSRGERIEGNKRQLGGSRKKRMAHSPDCGA